ncbi:MAG: hypothetical protein JWO38_2724 [Gemmataceae bacterium]|nr:hypothetical protein [Gemmataceae bacterium]
MAHRLEKKRTPGDGLIVRPVMLRGDRVTATGTLRVISHGAAVVNGVFVPG